MQNSTRSVSQEEYWPESGQDTGQEFGQEQGQSYYEDDEGAAQADFSASEKDTEGVPAPALLQIKASAGSGKTYDLTRRFLLRLKGAQADAKAAACALSAAGSTAWGDIIAVTFTNAAATEMKDRVIAALKGLALGLEAPEGVRMNRTTARTWVNRILRQYGALNIRTIDSLLHMLTRAAALDLNLPPEFEPVFATEDALLPVLDMIMEEAWRDNPVMWALLTDACRSLVHRQDRKGFLLGDKLLDQLRPLLDGALLGQYAQLSEPEELEEKLKHWRQEVRQAAATLDAQAASASLAWKKLARESLNRLMAGGAPFDQAWWQKEAKCAWWQKPCLSDCLLKSSPAPDDAAEAAFQALTTALTRLNTDGRLLLGGLARAPFILLAQALANGFSMQVQADGKVPSVLIPSMAASVLAEDHAAPEMLCRMGSRLTHFLIDEFQDTSREQWKALQPLIVQALSQGGSLTWVGDVKQAIYSWRGGDSSLFDGIGGLPALTNIAGTPAREMLETNWRSRAAVVTANNTVFSLLEEPEHAAAVLRLCLPADTADNLVNADSAGAQSIARAFAHTAQKLCPKLGMDGGYVSVQAVEADSSAELAEAVHEALLEKMRDIGARRPWGDIAILVRSNEASSLTAGWLMEAGIPVFTENSLLLKEHPLIEQTVAFLRFLHNPADDIACFTCMAGPLVEGLAEVRKEGFSRQSLTDVAASGRIGQPLHQKVRQQFRQVWTRIFSPFFLQAGLMSPYDTVQEWFSRLEANARFPEDAAFIRRFLEVVYAAEAQGHSTLPAFLEQWDTRGGEEKIPMADGIDAVRIITMHKAKGLEYPVVILPWMSFTVRASNAPVPVEVDGLRLLAPLAKEMGAPYSQSLAAAVQENLHLLYVAWTRARDELHCFHTATPQLRRSGSLVPALDWLLEQAGMTPPYDVGTPQPCAQGDRPALAANAQASSPENVLPASDNTAAPEKPQAMPAVQTAPAASIQPIAAPITALDEQKEKALSSVISSAAKTARAQQTGSQFSLLQLLPQAAVHTEAITEVIAEVAGAQANTCDACDASTDLSHNAQTPLEDPWENWRPMGWLPSLKVYRNPLGALLAGPEDASEFEAAASAHDSNLTDMTDTTAITDMSAASLPSAQRVEDGQPHSLRGGAKSIALDTVPTADVNAANSAATETAPAPLSLSALPVRIGALRGTLMHAALEHIRLTGHPEEDAAAAVRHALRTSADPLPDLPDLAEQLTRGAAWFAALPEARLWKQYGIPEQSLLDAQGEEHRVDLLLETAEGFLALEFKTGAPTDDHIRQVRRYLNLLGQLDSRPARGLLLYLDKHCCRGVTAEACTPLEASPRACGLNCRLPETQA